MDLTNLCSVIIVQASEQERPCSAFSQLPMSTLPVATRSSNVPLLTPLLLLTSLSSIHTGQFQAIGFESSWAMMSDGHAGRLGTVVSRLCETWAIRGSKPILRRLASCSTAESVAAIIVIWNLQKWHLPGMYLVYPLHMTMSAI